MLEKLGLYVQQKGSSRDVQDDKRKGEHALTRHFTMPAYKKNRLQVKGQRSKFERNTLSIRGPVLWNALLDNVKDAKNIQNFKYELKSIAISELKTTNFITGTTVTGNKDLKIIYIINNFKPNNFNLFLILQF